MNFPFLPLCLAASAAMTGVIWIIQLLVYPSFLQVPLRHWRVFHARHQNRISFVAGPLMMAELLLAGAWWFMRRGELSGLNLLGVLALWASTFLVSVPVHDRLRTEVPTPALLDRLWLGNWLRTALWSLRTALLLFFVLRG